MKGNCNVKSCMFKAQIWNTNRLLYAEYCRSHFKKLFYPEEASFLMWKTCKINAVYWKMICVLWNSILKFTRVYWNDCCLYISLSYQEFKCTCSFYPFFLFTACFMFLHTVCTLQNEYSPCFLYSYRLVVVPGLHSRISWDTAIQIIKLLMLKRGRVTQIFIKRLEGTHGGVILSVCHNTIY